MSSIVQKSFRGMSADVNPHDAPEGTVKDALNVVFRRIGVAEPRNGLFGLATSGFSAVANVQQMVPYDSGLCILDDAKVCLLDVGSSAVAVTDPDSAALAPFDGYCGTAQARGNLYIGTSKGIQKVTGADATSSEFAGVGANGSYVGLESFPDANENWLADGFVVGYRCVIRRKDANGVITRSRPSIAMRAKNTAAAAARSVEIELHVDTTPLAVGDVIEVYRTISVDASISNDLVPDTYYFAFEVEHDGSSSYQFVDDAPESDLGATLYSGELPASAKPYAGKCLASFAGSLFVGNCIGPYSKRLALKGGLNPIYEYINTTCSYTSGSPTITLGSTDVNLLGAAIEVGMIIEGTDWPNGTRVSSVSLPTITADQNATGTNAAGEVHFVDVVTINGSDSDVRLLFLENVDSSGLEYISERGIDDSANTSGPVNSIYFGGGLIIREVQPGGTAPTIKSTNAAIIWQEPIPEYDETAEAFERDVEPALLQWSLLDQPEMFTPGIGQAWVGNQQKAIWALQTYGDRLFIFKEDGVWILSGATERSGFRLDRFSDHIIMTPRHVCSTEQGVAVWTSDGIVIMSDSGAIDEISAQRVDAFLGRFPAPSDDPSVIAGNMFYDPANNELHFLAENLADATGHPTYDAPMHLVWNAKTRGWSRWALQSDAVVGCSPGYDNARHSFLTNESGNARIWSCVVPDVQAALEDGYCDTYEEATGLTVTMNQVSGSAWYFDHSFAAEIAPKAGDMVGRGSWFNLKGIVTSTADQGGGVTRVFFTILTGSLIDTSLYGSVFVVSAYTSEILLHALSPSSKAGWSMWQQTRWKLEGRTGLVNAVVGATSDNSLTEETRTLSEGTGALHANGRAGYPPWSPRHLYGRSHATAQSVSPFLRITEAGSVWALSACETEYERGSLEVSRA